MYKKLLFLLIALPLTHSTVCSYNIVAMRSVKNATAYSMLSIFCLGSMGIAAKLLLTDESARKELAPSMITAVILGTGISGFVSSGLQLIGITAYPTRMKSIGEFLISVPPPASRKQQLRIEPKKSVTIGQIVGLTAAAVYYYQNK